MKSAFALSVLLAVAAGPVQNDEKKKPSVLETIEPFRSYGHVYDGESIEAMRPRVMGTHGVLATGHYLSTLAGIEALRRGGNAFDAGVSAAMALKVIKMDYAGWTGVAPLILYSAREREVVTRVGAGVTPARATLEYFQKHGKTDVNTALIPADVDVWLSALDRYGTISFEEAARPALEVAEGGYHLYKHQKGLIDAEQEKVLRFPYNVQFWFPRGVGKQRLGDLMVNKDLGKLIRYMIDAEKKSLASGGTRSEGIRAARDAFYKGAPARAAAEVYGELEDGLVAYEDLAGYEGKWSKPLSTTFRGYDVFVPDGWSQGPRLILFLNLLESFDYESLGYNTAEYVHLLSQVINLGMSDSHKYVGDPDFTAAPAGLYSKEYARKRAELVDREKAFPDMPPWGDPSGMEAIAKDSPTSFTRPTDETSGRPLEDTTSRERHRLRREPLFDDGERWPPGQSAHSRVGVRSRTAHDTAQSRPVARERHGAQKATAQHEQPGAGDEGRKTLHGLIDSRRRRTAPGDPSGFLERRCLGNVTGAGPRSAAVRKLQLSRDRKRGERAPRGSEAGGSVPPGDR